MYHELKQKITQVQLRLSEKSHQIKKLEATIDRLDKLKSGVNQERENLEKEVTTIIYNITDSTINNHGVMNLGEVNGNISQH